MKLNEKEKLIWALAYMDAVDFAENVYNKWDRNDPGRKMALGMFQELEERKCVCKDYVDSYRGEK